MIRPDDHVGWYNDKWWKETHEMVVRGAEIFWRNRGLPEPTWQPFQQTFYDRELYESIEEEPEE